MSIEDGEVIGYIDITPKWESLLPLFMGVLTNPNHLAEARAGVRAELKRALATLPAERLAGAVVRILEGADVETELKLLLREVDGMNAAAKAD